MSTIIDQDSAPGHLSAIPELDFSSDLFAERVYGPWFRLGARTVTGHRDERGVEDVLSRQSILIPVGSFGNLFDKLESIGNVIHNLGKAQGWVRRSGQSEEYRYAPFYEFEFPLTSKVGEPLVFVRSSTSAVELFINPDLWMFFELEERSPGCGIWWDPRRGVDVLLHDTIDQGITEIVEIRADYLRRYLQARQKSLLVAHYRHLHQHHPPDTAIAAFVKEDVILGSPEQGTKAILQNWGLRDDMAPVSPPFLQRRLHLWFEVRPMAVDMDDPWTEQPDFDPYAFTLPTRNGPVAPARWRRIRNKEGRSFEGGGCDFMEFVYFRQEVLAKYQGASGFNVGDNGSVSHYPYWSLSRSTMRIGNELVATAIGDFAEGVPFDEWPHWKQYAVEPPRPETARALGQEQGVPEAVNSLVKALTSLNDSFAEMGVSLGVADLGPLWDGSADSLAGQQLKWVYPATADDDEFLKRATLVSTLVVEALKPQTLRKLLGKIGEGLHLNSDNPPKSLGSLNLLQKLTFVATLIADLRPDIDEIPSLVSQAENTNVKRGQHDLQKEIERTYTRVRRELEPVAFLYDLRTHGGLAHAPNRKLASSAAVNLGLPNKNWHRTDYLRLLDQVTRSIHQVNCAFRIAAQVA